MKISEKNDNNVFANPVIVMKKAIMVKIEEIKID